MFPAPNLPPWDISVYNPGLRIPTTHWGLWKLGIEEVEMFFSSFGVRFPLTSTMNVLHIEEISTSGLSMHTVNQDL